MIALLRFLIAGFVILTIVYIGLSLYARSARRHALQREWDEEVGAGDRDAYIAEGLARYDRSLRRKLILGVYIVPAIAVGTIIYITNYM